MIFKLDCSVNFVISEAYPIDVKRKRKSFYSSGHIRKIEIVFYENIK